MTLKDLEPAGWDAEKKGPFWAAKDNAKNKSFFTAVLILSFELAQFDDPIFFQRNQSKLSARCECVLRVTTGVNVSAHSAT